MGGSPPYFFGSLMARHNHLILCDICGFQFHRNQVRKNWKGQIVCHVDYEPKHPQLTIPAVRDRMSVKDARVPDDPPLDVPPFTVDDII